MKSKKLICFFIISFIILSIFPKISYAVEFKVSAGAAILYNTNMDKIVYSKNADKKMYPASTTKMITAILILENCDLNDTATVSSTAIQIPSFYTTAYLKEGEICTLKDLLYMTLIISANDAANVLAEYMAGSTEEFAVIMNEKAKKIGCTNTNFVNPSGIHDENHYSTANDLLKIAKYVMQNETFKEIVSTPSYTVGATNKSSERVLYSTNSLIKKINEKTNTENVFYYEYATGIKTGYTNEAGNCLVASAKKGNDEYFVVLLGEMDTETNTSSQRFTDAKLLFETAFKNYSIYPIRKENEVITTVTVSNANGEGKNLDLVLEKNLNLFFERSDAYAEIQHEMKIDNSKLQAPIEKGEIIGTLTYTYNGEKYTENLVAANDVQGNNDPISNYYKLALGALTILIICTILGIIKKGHK